jgi:hypothetical protein
VENLKVSPFISALTNTENKMALLKAI